MNQFLIFKLIQNSLVRSIQTIPAKAPWHICRGKYTPLPAHLSVDVHDIVSKMLVVDPSKRITLDDILLHSWTQMPFAQSTGTVRG